MKNIIKTILYSSILLLAMFSVGNNPISAQSVCQIGSSTLEKSDGSAIAVGDNVTLTLAQADGSDCNPDSDITILVIEQDNGWDNNIAFQIQDQNFPAGGEDFSIDLITGDLECEGTCTYFVRITRWMLTPTGGATETTIYNGADNGELFSWTCSDDCDDDEWGTAGGFISDEDCVIDSINFSPANRTVGQETLLTLTPENPAYCINKEFNLNIASYPFGFGDVAAINIDEQHFDSSGSYSTNLVVGDTSCNQVTSGTCKYFPIIDDGDGVDTYDGETDAGNSVSGSYVTVDCGGACGNDSWAQGVIQSGGGTNRCTLNSVSFSPPSSSSSPADVGDAVSISLNPMDATLCAGQEFILELRRYEPGGFFGDFSWDSQAFQTEELFFNSNGLFAANINVGDTACVTSSDCRFYVNVYADDDDTMADYSGQSDVEANIASRYMHVACNGNGCGNDPWTMGNVTTGTQGTGPAGAGECIITSVSFSDEGDLFNQGDQSGDSWPGFQGAGSTAWQNFYPFILRDHPAEEPGPPIVDGPDSENILTISINGTNCNYQQDFVGLKVEIYDIGTNILNVNERAETADFYALMENNQLFVNYRPGDEDCDQPVVPQVSGKPIKACNYGVVINKYSLGETLNPNIFLENGANRVATIAYDPTTDEHLNDRFRWYCLSNNCSSSNWSLPWEIISHSSYDPPDTGWGVDIVPPSFDTNSPCYETAAESASGVEGYNDNCYEFLAPIPGVGGTNDDAPGRFFINTVEYGLGNYVNQVFQVALGILIVIAVLMIVIAGVQYMTTEAITSKGEARSRITNALLGLILGLGIFIILRTINPRLLNINFGSDISTINLVVGDPADFEPGGSSANPIMEQCRAGRKNRGIYSTADEKQARIEDTAANASLVSLSGTGFIFKSNTNNPLHTTEAQKVATSQFKSKLINFHNEIQTEFLSRGIDTPLRITELFGPSSTGHGSPCHYFGSCIDLATGTSPADTQYTPEIVSIVIRAADNNGLSADFELVGGNPQSYLEDDILTCHAFIVSHATAPHWSIYDTTN